MANIRHRPQPIRKLRCILIRIFGVNLPAFVFALGAASLLAVANSGPASANNLTPTKITFAIDQPSGDIDSGIAEHGFTVVEISRLTNLGLDVFTLHHAAAPAGLYDSLSRLKEAYPAAVIEVGGDVTGGDFEILPD